MFIICWFLLPTKELLNRTSKLTYRTLGNLWPNRQPTFCLTVLNVNGCACLRAKAFPFLIDFMSCDRHEKR